MQKANINSPGAYSSTRRTLVRFDPGGGDCPKAMDPPAAFEFLDPNDILVYAVTKGTER